MVRNGVGSRFRRTDVDVRPTRNGVGSRFRRSIYHMESGFPENDSRPHPIPRPEKNKTDHH
jgi:hypothetical protein